MALQLRRTILTIPGERTVTEIEISTDERDVRLRHGDHLVETRVIHAIKETLLLEM